jgi:hypothetical protein
LSIKNNLNVNLGDVILYVNNGTKASQGDVQKMTVKQIKDTNNKCVSPSISIFDM